MVPQFLTIGSAITRSASCRIAKWSPASGAASQVRVPGQRADAQLAARPLDNSAGSGFH